MNEITEIIKQSKTLCLMLSPNCPSCNHHDNELMKDVRTICGEATCRGRNNVHLIVVMQGNSRYNALKRLYEADNPDKPLDKAAIFYRNKWYFKASELVSPVLKKRRLK